MLNASKAYAVDRMSDAKLHEALGTELMRAQRLVTERERPERVLYALARAQQLAGELRLRGTQLTLGMID